MMQTTDHNKEIGGGMESKIWASMLTYHEKQEITEKKMQSNHNRDVEYDKYQLQKKVEGIRDNIYQNAYWYHDVQVLQKQQK